MAREKDKRRCGLCSKPISKGVNCASCSRRLEAGETGGSIMAKAKDIKPVGDAVSRATLEKKLEAAQKRLQAVRDAISMAEYRRKSKGQRVQSQAEMTARSRFNDAHSAVRQAEEALKSAAPATDAGKLTPKDKRELENLNKQHWMKKLTPGQEGRKRQLEEYDAKGYPKGYTTPATDADMPTVSSEEAHRRRAKLHDALDKVLDSRGAKDADSDRERQQNLVREFRSAIGKERLKIAKEIQRIEGNGDWLAGNAPTDIILYAQNEGKK